MLDILLLGPTEAFVNGLEVSLSPLERNVLAILALSRNAVVSTERIIELLWNDRHPAAPRSRVQGLVSALRRKIGSALVTRHPGYLLDAAGSTTDLERMHALVRCARRAPSTGEAAVHLRSALDLWRGDPLDGVSAPGTDGERVRLAELRVGLHEELFEAALALAPPGDPDLDLVGEITALLAANPLRERLAGQLMRALVRANRQADALRVYEAMRKRLAEELGSDPCADLRSLYAAVLRGDADPPPLGAAAPVRSLTALPEVPSPVGLLVGGTAAPGGPPGGGGALTGSEIRAVAGLPFGSGSPPGVPSTGGHPAAPVSGPLLGMRPPATLPASVGHFTGRDEAVKALTDAVTRPADEPRIVFVCGLGGVGKTALVVKWAHGAGNDFPDGQIFLDLHGGALPPLAALGAVLTALGTARDELPDGLDERTALYRAQVNGRRVLIVADDAGSVEQLLPLVPPTAAGQLVVTCRLRLPAFAAHHAVEVLTLEPLTPEATRELLERIAGRELRHHDPAAQRLLRWCGGYPLSVRKAGMLLAARPGQRLESFVDELTEGADPFGTDPHSLRTALAAAHRSLSPAAAHLFGRLGLERGATVTVDRSLAATDRAMRRVRQLFDELVAANLLVESGPDEYRFHDLVHRFARECGADLVDRDVVDEWMRGRQSSPAA